MLLRFYWATSTPHHQPIFNIFCLFKLFFSLLICHFTIIHSLTFIYFYLFIFLLLYTLTLQFLHPFIFLLFWLFFAPIFYYKNLLFSIPFNPYFAHTKRWILSLSLSLSLYIYIYSFLWWMFNSLDWWIFMFNSILVWYDLVIF